MKSSCLHIVFSFYLIFILDVNEITFHNENLSEIYFVWKCLVPFMHGMRFLFVNTLDKSREQM